MDTDKARSDARGALRLSGELKLREGTSKDNLANLSAMKEKLRSTLHALEPDLKPPPPPPPPEEHHEEPQPTETPLLDMVHVRDWFGTNANAGDIVDVSDGIQLTVPNDHEAGSHSGNPRAELLTKPQFTNGDEVWLRSRIFIPGPVPGGWSTLWSFFNAGGSIAPWHISCVGGKFGWQTPPGPMAWDEPVTLGRWIDLLHHHRFGGAVQLETWLKIEGKDSSWRQVWGTSDGKSATWTSGNSNSANYFKACAYYQKGTMPKGDNGFPRPFVVKFGRTILGRSRASVGG